MSFAAPFSLVMAIVIPCWLSAQGYVLKRIAFGAAGFGLTGLVLFLRNPPSDALSTDLGTMGTVGVLMMVAGLISGITLAILGIVQQMTGKTKR